MRECICGGKKSTSEHAPFCEAFRARPTRPLEFDSNEPAEQLSLLPEPSFATPALLASDLGDETDPTGERRQLTVMFCDIKDSTEISEQLGTDALCDLIRSYHETCRRVVARHGGYVAQFLGDGLLVYFGFPHAREDAAERAVRSGLELFDALDDLNARLQSEHGVWVESRVGINTGEVLMVELGSTSNGQSQILGIGEPVNIAARLQHLAAPGSVTLTDRTLALLSPAIKTSRLGLRRLKGVSEPILIHRALRCEPAAGSTQVCSRKLTGRDGQLNSLVARFEGVQEKGAHVALIEGAAGVGKSVLLQKLQQSLATVKHLWLSCVCSDYPGEGGLQPVLTLIGDNLGFHQEMSPAERLSVLERELRDSGFVSQNVPSVLAPLLGLPIPETGSYGAAERQAGASLLLAWLRSLAKEQPVVIVLEDLHLADSPMRELVKQHIAEISDEPVLTLITSRPGEHWRWQDSPRVDVLELAELDAEEVAQIVIEVAGDREPSQRLVEGIVERSGGNALFAEELTRAVLATPAPIDGDPIELLDKIPDRLRDLLMSRLDQLGGGKYLAQIASVLGQRWNADLLGVVGGVGHSELVHGLEELSSAGVIKRAPGAGESTYMFRHSLIQEMAYESLSVRRRRALHRTAAEAWELSSPEMCRLQPQLLAVHYEGAGEAGKAADLWEAAGRQAIGRSSHAEAIPHLQRSLGLLRGTPELARDVQREIELEQSLGVSLQVVKGYAAPEAERTFERARELCRQLGNADQAFAVISGLAVKCLLRADLKAALSMALELRETAERSADDLLILWASVSLGTVHFYRGDFCASLRVLNAGLEHAHGLELGAARDRYAGDPAIDALVQASLALWMLGRRSAALDHLASARRLATEAGLSPALGFLGVAECFLRYLDSDTARVATTSAEVLELSELQGLELWGSFARVQHGWSETRLGRIEVGLAEIETGLDRLEVTGARLGRSFLLVLWADACRHAGRSAQALQIVRDALVTRHQTGERYLDAELYRLLGELLRTSDEPDRERSEALFRRARMFAHRQRAEFWESRATQSLATLWAERGETERARRVLLSHSRAAHERQGPGAL